MYKNYKQILIELVWLNGNEDDVLGQFCNNTGSRESFNSLLLLFYFSVDIFH